LVLLHQKSHQKIGVLESSVEHSRYLPTKTVSDQPLRSITLFTEQRFQFGRYRSMWALRSR
jgi:hypothetical protein